MNSVMHALVNRLEAIQGNMVAVLNTFHFVMVVFANRRNTRSR